MCKDGVRVLNFARGELVDNAALLDALNSGKVAQYFCDFPTEELLASRVSAARRIWVPARRKARRTAP